MARSKATDRQSMEEWVTPKHRYKVGGKTPTGCRINRLFIKRSNDEAHQKMLGITCLDGGSRDIRLQDAHQVSLSGGEKRASVKVSMKKVEKVEKAEKVKLPVAEKDTKKGAKKKRRGGFSPTRRAASALY